MKPAQELSLCFFECAHRKSLGTKSFLAHFSVRAVECLHVEQIFAFEAENGVIPSDGLDVVRLNFQIFGTIFTDDP